MPLKSGSSPATISENIRELHHGPKHAQTARKFGEERAHEQSIAIALETARKTKRADGGQVSDDAPQVNVVKSPAEDFKSTTDAIASSYPTLQPYLQNLAIQRGTSSGPDDDRQLEFYQPWDSDNPNPGKITSELYNSKLQGQDLTETVAGDMLHHLGTVNPSTGQPVDPTWMAMKQQLVGAMGPDQQRMDQEAYQQEKSNPSYETAPYNEWMQNNRADAYIRGAVFPNQNPEWQEEGTYTPAMKDIAKKMKDYLTGNANVDKRRGGSVNLAMDIARRLKRAKGGKVHVGPIIGTTGGRADKRPMEVPDGAYVLTADHVSGIGEGNTHAGMDRLNRMFPHSAKAHHELAKVLKRASGGKVPIYAADGEYVIHPQDLIDRFGSLEEGHKQMDNWQTHERHQLIHTLKNLDGPAQD